VKLVTTPDAAQAVQRNGRGLDACVIEGVRTTIPFLRVFIDSGEFRQGRVHTQMLEQGAFNA